MIPLLCALLFASAFRLVTLRRTLARDLANRPRLARRIRRLLRDRDAREESFQAAVEVCKEEVAKNSALTEELVSYWETDEKAERVRVEELN